jgi:hypothetical protein
MVEILAQGGLKTSKNLVLIYSHRCPQSYGSENQMQRKAGNPLSGLTCSSETRLKMGQTADTDYNLSLIPSDCPLEGFSEYGIVTSPSDV